MKAVYLHGIRDLRMHDDPMPKLSRPDEVLIKMGAVGVCGSDCHFYERGRIGHFVVNEPLILGHEVAGQVMEVGGEVTNVAPGDLVAIEPGIPCRRCRRCREGRYNICEVAVYFMAAPPDYQGAFREYFTWPADFVYRLPAGLSVEDGAMIEPLAVGVHACRRAEIRPGQSAAVLGAGPIGLLAMQAAAAYGAYPVIATDVIPFRLDLVRQLGAEALDASAGDPVEAIRDMTGGRGADVVIETAGTMATIQQAMKAVKNGGVVVPVGLPPEDQGMLPVMDMLQREYDLRPVFRYANCYPPAIAMVAAGKIALGPLRTHEYRLEETDAALTLTITGKTEAIKVLVKP
ncbi:MAG: NAD(P)-dependent alcohol dehydrogenase [Armatimonadota bacterium]|jgi:L-iditol 2-dehydrogenase